MLRLVISDNEGTTTVVPLVRDEISIGRKEGNTIRLTERNVSRHHARLQRENGAYRVRDLDSYNGTLVNGERIEGERDVGPGDQIAIGDYAILVEAEAEVAAGAPAEPVAPAAIVREEDPTQVAPTKPAPSLAPAVARLVVLAGPGAGRELALPAGGSTRIGRAEELDLCIDHRSVSREHAELTVDDAGVRIRDLGSSNGLRVNGDSADNRLLRNGDAIELGEVVLRFVAAGERYVYDPADAAPYLSRETSRGKPNLLLAAGIVVAALVVAIVIVTSGEDAPETIAASPPEAVEPQVVQPEAVEVPTPAAEDPYPGALAQCRGALEGGRFAEAMAHAAVALRARGDGAEAQACQRAAQAGLEQEQAFVRARAALEAGDLDGAQRELSSIAPDSPLLANPDVAAAIEQLARGLLDQAREHLEEAPGISVRLAQDVLDLGGASDALRAEASQLLAKARSAPKSAAKPKAAAKPSQARPARTASAAPRKSPMDVANACLLKGDNPCVIKALSGKAKTAQELGLLIETYRAMGKTDQAYKHMAQYVKRFPTARRASAYQRMLERR